MFPGTELILIALSLYEHSHTRKIIQCYSLTKKIGYLNRLYRHTICILLSYVKVLEYLDGFLIHSDVRRLIVAYQF